MSPTSSTTTRSQRPLKSSSRSPPATAGPQTCMTWRSMTTPSAKRSLHHCSLRSEKIQRAVDKLITLLTKACCHYNPLTGYEPKLIDDLDHSETSAMIFQDESGGVRRNSTMRLSEKRYHSSIRSEKYQRRQAYNSHEESLLPAQSLSHTQVR